MALFRPVRSSTPPRARSLGTNTLVPTSAVSDASKSSIQSTSELAALTADDIDFIDAVIARAPLNSTTFLSLFKAYDLELSARGLRSEDEVDYYSKLLKIGTLKGASWEEKWRMVKAQYSYKPATARAKSGLGTGFARSTPTTTSVAPERLGTARLLQRLRILQHGDVHEGPESPVRGIFSQTEATELTETESQVDVAPPRFVPYRSPSPSQLTATDDSHDAYDTTSQPPTSAQPARRFSPWSANDSQMSEDDAPLATTTPSYHPTPSGAYARDTKTHMATPIPSSRTPLARASRPTSVQRPPSPPKSQAPMRPSTSTKTVHAPYSVDDDKDDAWERIKMQQDEEIADQFWEDRLVERCWYVWKQGYEWTMVRAWPYFSRPFEHKPHPC
jgi:protein SFI1